MNFTSLGDKCTVACQIQTDCRQKSTRLVIIFIHLSENQQFLNFGS